MSSIGIDLSLRSTGIVYIADDYQIQYKLIQSSNKHLNNEELLIYNSDNIIQFIKLYEPDIIGLEGLSFGSMSGSKDILAGNLWNLRVNLYQQYRCSLEIIPVLTWRSKLFNKEERKLHKENEKKAKAFKDSIKHIKSRNDKNQLLEENKQLLLDADIKYLTWKKLPANVANMFEEVGFDNGGFDLTDAYFIAQHVRSNQK